MSTIAPARPSLLDDAVRRRTLLTQRAFRREQLEQLGRHRRSRPLSGAYREVYVSLAVGARSALHDIEAALRRMDEGRYGVCEGCGTRLDPQVLDALPQAARCVPCQRGAAPR